MVDHNFKGRSHIRLVPKKVNNILAEGKINIRRPLSKQLNRLIRG